MSPVSTIRSAPATSGSFNTVSRAGRTPWMSDNTDTDATMGQIVSGRTVRRQPIQLSANPDAERPHMPLIVRSPSFRRVLAGAFALFCQAGKEFLGGGAVYLAQPLRAGAVVGGQAVVEAGAPFRVCVGEIAAVEDVARLRERQK